MKKFDKKKFDILPLLETVLVASSPIEAIKTYIKNTSVSRREARKRIKEHNKRYSGN